MGTYKVSRGGHRGARLGTVWRTPSAIHPCSSFSSDSALDSSLGDDAMFIKVGIEWWLIFGEVLFGLPLRITAQSLR